jgi:hypothetical protein
MDEDQVAGSAKEIKGAVKQTAGKVLGDAKLQSVKPTRLRERFRMPSAV